MLPKMNKKLIKISSVHYRFLDFKLGKRSTWGSNPLKSKVSMVIFKNFQGFHHSIPDKLVAYESHKILLNIVIL